MSDAPHVKGAHEAHTATHGHEVYEGKAADTIPPDEPHSPGWLPLLGAALLLIAVLAVALVSPPEGNADDASAAPAAGNAEVAAAASAPPAAQARPAAPARPVRPGASAPLRVPGLASGMVRARPPGARPAGQDQAGTPGMRPVQRPAPPSAAPAH